MPASAVSLLLDREQKCTTCLDLDYQSFERSWNGGFDEFIKTRYHVTRPEEIEASAHKGCLICSILYEGINLYWSTDAEEEVGWEGEDDQVTAEIILGCKRKREEKKSIFHWNNRMCEDCGDEDNEQQEDSIHLAISPGRPFFLYRTRGGRSMFCDFRTRLEFFTETGRVYLSIDMTVP